jgi:hypothetical protein
MLRKLLLLLVLVAPCAWAQAPPKFAIETSLYPYLDPVENDTDLSVFVNWRRLPARFSYFSFMNFRGAATDGDFEFSRSEQNLRWSVFESLPIDLNLQAILINGADDIVQLGIGWRVHSTPGLSDFFRRNGLVYRVTWQFKRFTDSGDDSAWQLEHFFKWTVPGINRRLYLSGFIDQTFDLNLPDAFPSVPMLIEIQGGVRLFGEIYAVAEYRSNDFRLGDETNLAVGIEYKFLFD